MAKKVDFEYIDQDPYDKTPEWMAISPTGLVPVIVDGGKTVYESAICVEYVDEAFSTDVSLLPKDPYKRALARIWGDFLGKNVSPNYFRAIRKKTKEEQEEHLEKFEDGLKKFLAAMDPNTTYLQGETLGYLDIIFAPWANLLKVLKHFSGYEVPQTPEFVRFHKWWDVAKSHPAVIPVTEIPLEKFVTRYEKLFRA